MNKRAIILIAGLFITGNVIAILDHAADGIVKASKTVVSTAQDINKGITDPFAGEFADVDSQSEMNTSIKPAVDISEEKTKTGPDAFTDNNYIYDGTLLQYTKENPINTVAMAERKLVNGKVSFRSNKMISLTWNAHSYGEIKSVEIHAWNTKIDLTKEKLQTPEGRLYVYNQVNGYILSPFGLAVNDHTGQYIIYQENSMKNLYIWIELKTTDDHVILSNILKF